MKGWAGSAAEISATGLKIVPYKHFISATEGETFRQNSFAFVTERLKRYNVALCGFLFRKYANYLCY